MESPAELKVDEKAIREIISTRGVATFFQPTVSVTSKSIIGFEAYSRGGGRAGLSTDMLFNDGFSPDVTLEVDRLCRWRALEHFKSIHEQHRKLLLFVNINPNVIPLVGRGSMHFAEQVREAGIDPACVVLECPMNTPHMEEVAEYAALFQEKGFSVCLDDCSVQYPFTSILSRVSPDYVKVNRTFFSEHGRGSGGLAILESLISVAGRVGAGVIAQCVESQEESVALLSAGVHLQQGYYYTKGEPGADVDPAKAFFQKVFEANARYKAAKSRLVRFRKERFAVVMRSASILCNKLSNMTEDRFEEGCRAAMQGVEGLVSLFVVDDRGTQITHRLCADPALKSAATAVLGTFKGADLSAEDYVLYLDMGYEKFVTSPFVSAFTGRKARIISRPFFAQNGLRYIACMELTCPEHPDPY